MASVFPGGQTHAGTFRADLLTLSIGGTQVKGLMFQQVTYQFEQQIRTFFEVASNFVYWIGGRAEGTANVSRLLGPNANGAKSIVQTYRDPCNPQDLGLSSTVSQCLKTDNSSNLKGVTTGAQDHKLTLKSAILRGIGGSVAAQDVTFTQSLAFMFVDMEDSQVA